MKARQNGPGSNEAPHSRESGSRSGKFLAKLVPLMTGIQPICRAMSVRE